MIYAQRPLARIAPALAPLFRPFNVAVTTLANATNPLGWHVASDAPNTLESLTAAYQRDGRITVWEGASECTIFGSPDINHAFRAWHDAVHVRCQFAFDAAGERAACEVQQAQLARRYGGSPFYDVMRVLLDVEIVAQLEHEQATGEFPADQRAFTLAELERRGVYLPT